MRKPLAIIASAALALCLTGCSCEHESTTELTCTENKECKECGEVLEETTGHTLGTPFVSVNLEDATITEQSLCSVCEEYVVINSDEAASYVSDGKFIFGHSAFANGFDNASNGINGYIFRSEEDYSTSMGFYDDDNYIYYKIVDEDRNDATIGMYSFANRDGETLLARGGDDIKTINILIDGNEYVSPVVWAAVMAIDPALNYSDSMDVAQNIVDNVGNMDGVTFNSINYVLYEEGAYHYLTVSAI
ncbi:hypothetical protein [Adlercreutzia sp. ZJ242]|uniref:hypothetical protein n=1 Tax=Adlercreutzia sp. ZJ242 TaxID=2709409 RepID=UPI0013E9DBF9|nr:hypothetical protein [Adlercreutzia sp. ZJ242]